MSLELWRVPSSAPEYKLLLTEHPRHKPSQSSAICEMCDREEKKENLESRVGDFKINISELNVCSGLLLNII